MKLHNTLINKLVKVMEINSGWRDEKKLKAALAALNIAVYTQQTGQEVLVDAVEMANLRSDVNK
tara:strand:+ start:7760 stop:7951 length:192 start_codon:yes stop_codon:yes gene_type:complete